MMRRRRGARHAREGWRSGWLRPLARLSNSQVSMAAMNPRADRIAELLGLGPGKRYLDIGCGTAPFAHLLAERSGLPWPPITVDLTHGSGVEVEAWPEQLPFRDRSFDAITSLHFIRRFEDDVVHQFAVELGRVLAPGGSGIITEFAPVRFGPLDRAHHWITSGGCNEVDLRGWGRLAAQMTECGFDAVNLVDLGPYFLPPIPRVSVLVRKAGVIGLADGSNDPVTVVETGDAGLHR